uniref:N-acetyltransferase domain-containing protein n=1 Tax=Anopheles melas TaxID=34690 RepID=A0A182UIJ6_9DIPT
MEPGALDYEYAPATEADRAEVRQALATYFYPEEPLTLAHRDGPFVTEDDMENALSFLAQGTTILARTAANGELVGVSIGGSSAHEISVPITTQKLTDIVAFLEMLDVRAYGFARSSSAYHVYALAVHPAHRAHSIGRRLMEEQIALVRARWPAFAAVTVETTGPGSGRLMRRIGMRETGRLSFADYRDAACDQVFLGAGENVGAQAEHTLEPGPVQLDALERSAGDHGGGTGSIKQQRNLAEVVRRAQATDFRCLFALQKQKRRH